MKILFALNTFRPHIDGVGVSVERQASGLSARGHSVAIVAPSPRLHSYVERVDGYQVLRFRAVAAMGGHRRIPVLADRAIVRALTDFDPDIVVVSMPFLLSRSTWSAASEYGYPIVGITGMMPEWFSYNFASLRPFSRFVEACLWRLITNYYDRCDHVVGVTKTALKYLTDHGLKPPASIVSNGVPLRRFRPRARDARLAQSLGVPDKPTVLYAGRLDAEKCIDVLIRAIPIVTARIDAHFVIGGEGGEKNRLERLASQLGCGASVSFPGFLPEMRYARLFSLANVFAIPSPCELQSVVSLEAAASGLPIVAANAGALPEIVRNGGNGWLFPVGDVNSLAEGLTTLLSEGALAKSMGQASRAIAEEHDIEQTVDKFEAIYREVSAVRRRWSWVGSPETRPGAVST